VLAKIAEDGRRGSRPWAQRNPRHRQGQRNRRPLAPGTWYGMARLRQGTAQVGSASSSPPRSSRARYADPGPSTAMPRLDDGRTCGPTAYALTALTPACRDEDPRAGEEGRWPDRVDPSPRQRRPPRPDQAPALPSQRRRTKPSRHRRGATSTTAPPDQPRPTGWTIHHRRARDAGHRMARDRLRGGGPPDRSSRTRAVAPDGGRRNRGWHGVGSSCVPRPRPGACPPGMAGSRRSGAPAPAGAGGAPGSRGSRNRGRRGGGRCGHGRDRRVSGRPPRSRSNGRPAVQREHVHANGRADVAVGFRRTVRSAVRTAGR